MISRLFILAIFVVAGFPARAQAKPDCPAPCVAEVSFGAMDDRLNLDTGSAIRKQVLDSAMRKNTAAGPFANGGGIIPFAVGSTNLGKGAWAERRVKYQEDWDDPDGVGTSTFFRVLDLVEGTLP